MLRVQHVFKAGSPTPETVRKASAVAACCRTVQVYGVSVLLLALVLAHHSVYGQEPRAAFGGAYSGLDARRQRLVENWVTRFTKATGQRVEPAAFYDDILSMSTKTTFDAVTHALMTTRLTDRTRTPSSDALSLIAEVDAVRGEVAGEPGDRQFRLYVRLVDDGVDQLERSQEFRRGLDNSIYHKGYPINYRAQGGVPSIQISIAQDRRRADIDVDYRSASFPAGLFNGHLTSSNSDVRAGDNFDRHLNRWTGFQNWWRSFFGVRQERTPEAALSSSPLALPRVPRAGKATIDLMVGDFLRAWLVDGDVVASMGYVSDRAYACLARDTDDPAHFDRGVAPFQLMVNLKSAHEALAPRATLDGLVVGTRLVRPGLRVVRQPHHAQFVIYAVPDDVAAAFDCESRLALGNQPRPRRVYGNYFGATFYIDGRRDTPVALLWAREQGYWKIVSWRVGADDAATPHAAPIAEPKIARIAADPGFAQAARQFLDAWLLRHDPDAAFQFVSSRAYDCYDLERGDSDTPATSTEDAGRKLRASLAESGRTFGTARSLDQILTAAEPIHSAIRVQNHPDVRTYTLTSVPNALADLTECAARAKGLVVPDPMPLEYGKAFGMALRFKTRGGDAPVLRLLWRNENGAFRIVSYGIELP